MVRSLNCVYDSIKTKNFSCMLIALEKRDKDRKRVAEI